MIFLEKAFDTYYEYTVWGLWEKYKNVFEINEFKYFWPLNISMTVENFIYEIKNCNEMKKQYLPMWIVDSETMSHVINGKNTVIHVI